MILFEYINLYVCNCMNIYIYDIVICYSEKCILSLEIAFLLLWVYKKYFWCFFCKLINEWNQSVINLLLPQNCYITLLKQKSSAKCLNHLDSHALPLSWSVCRLIWFPF